MKSRKAIAVAVALSMGLSNLAIAHGGTYGQRGDGSRAEQRDGRHGGDRAQERRGERRVDRREGRRDWRHDARIAGGRHDAHRKGPRDPHGSRWSGRWSRGDWPQHEVYRGGRLPPRYRSPVYVVNDWRGHGLRRPPAGHHWVQAGGDYVLAAIATGVVLSILLSR